MLESPARLFNFSYHNVQTAPEDVGNYTDTVYSFNVQLVLVTVTTARTSQDFIGRHLAMPVKFQNIHRWEGWREDALVTWLPYKYQEGYI